MLYRENGQFKADITLQHEGICLALLFSWLAKVQSAGGIRCAVEELRAGVAEIDFAWVDGRAVSCFGLVVDDSGVWTCFYTKSSSQVSENVLSNRLPT